MLLQGWYQHCSQAPLHCMFTHSTPCLVVHPSMLLATTPRLLLILLRLSLLAEDEEDEEERAAAVFQKARECCLDNSQRLAPLASGCRHSSY